MAACANGPAAKDIVGSNFYDVMGTPEILGPDFCPFHTALATGRASGSTLRCFQNRYMRVHAAPVIDADGSPQSLVVTIREVTDEVLQQQKLSAIHQAGIELADLTPDEVSKMSVEERIELLRANILHCTQDVLQYNVVEIRMLDPNTRILEPVLAVGMTDEAAKRELRAETTGNGVTGFVAATGKSYLCEDTSEDPLYLEGAAGARSSLTVPVMLHDRVTGTLNVESPEPRAFSESDLQFLEIFARDVAMALNTLELLAAEKASTAAASVEAIHSAVALPVDDILNDAVNVMERYIGHQPDVVERLQQILRNARDIKQVIQKIGQSMAPAEAATVCGARRAASAVGGPPRAGRRRGRKRPQRGSRAAGALSLHRRNGPRRQRSPIHGAQPGGGSALRRHHRRHSPPDMSRLRPAVEAQGDDGAGADGADDRLRLRSGPLDRQGAAGRLAGGALQTVPARPVAGDCRAARYRQRSEAAGQLGGLSAAPWSTLLLSRVNVADCVSTSGIWRGWTQYSLAWTGKSDTRVGHPPAFGRWMDGTLRNHAACHSVRHRRCIDRHLSNTSGTVCPFRADYCMGLRCTLRRPLYGCGFATTLVVSASRATRRVIGKSHIVCAPHLR